jgi:osmoprotectant transport system permease protein
VEIFVEMFNMKDLIIDQTIEHLYLTAIAVLIAAGLGIPGGILISRLPWLTGITLGLANILQTVPSLAMFAFFMPVLGIGSDTAITALVLYALLPIIKNTYSGISGVSPAIREAAKGMGMTGWQLLFMVELPLSFPVLLAGLRTALVMTVNLATLSALIGGGGLGRLIFLGLSRVDTATIMAGAIPAAILAITIDYLMGTLEKLSVSRNKNITFSFEAERGISA